jgi:hypothetical protein
MNRNLGVAAFVLGLAAVLWVGVGYATAWHPLALLMTVAIGAFYLMGAVELRRFQQATASLQQALAAVPTERTDALPPLDTWLAQLHPSLQHPVRQRIEGTRVPLPGPALTPYLVGLLVMLGMLGTFLGMVVTLNGAVLALESTTDLATIRAALSAPVKGLGLAFGTSVAGVAASAMLGLMSATCRRERLQAAQALDARISGALRGFSLTHQREHQREQMFETLQSQARVVPDAVGQLQATMQALISQMERQSSQQTDRLLAGQEAFFKHSQSVVAELASSVDRSLQHSLAETARLTGALLQKEAQATLAGIAREAATVHERVAGTVAQQLDGVSARLGQSAGAMENAWGAALARHEHSSDALAQRLQQTLHGFTGTFEQRSAQLLAAVEAAQSSGQSALAQTWRNALDEHQRTSAEVSSAMQQAVAALAETGARQSATLLDGVRQQAATLIGSVQQQSATLIETVQQQSAALAQVSAQQSTALIETQAQQSAALIETQAKQSAALLDGTRQQAATLLDGTREQTAALLDGTREQVAALMDGARQQSTALMDSSRAQTAALVDSTKQQSTALMETTSQQSTALIETTSQQSAALLEKNAQQCAALIDTAARQSAALLAKVDEAHAALQADLAARDQQRQDALAQSLEAMAAALKQEWAAAGNATAEHQQRICHTLEQTAQRMHEQAELHARATIGEIAQLTHTAAEAPRAAAELMGQLRQQLSDSLARDTELLAERQRIMDTLRTLLDAIQHAATEQRGAIDALVSSSSTLLQQVGTQLTERIGSEADRLADVAAQVTGSALEVGSLGEAFTLGVQRFSESSDGLIGTLQRIEAALGKSTARSDEQLAYYVAQAREIIDLSMLSQKQIVEDMQQLQRRQASLAEEG